MAPACLANAAVTGAIQEATALRLVSIELGDNRELLLHTKRLPASVIVCSGCRMHGDWESGCCVNLCCLYGLLAKRVT